MGILKALTLAGVALVGASQLTHAADMMPPPMAAPMAEPLRGTVAPEFSGWYLRGDVGAGLASTGAWTQPPGGVGVTQTTVSTGISNTTVSDSAFVDFGVGYQVNNWFRADVVGILRGSGAAAGLFQQSVRDTAACTYAGAPAVGPCNYLYQNNYRGKLRSMALMVNGYADLGTWSGITPYIGAGVGMARHSMTGWTDSGVAVAGSAVNAQGLPNGPSATVATSPIDNKVTYSLAWSLMAGLSYDVSQNLKLDIGYRYLNMGKAASGDVRCICGNPAIFPGFKMASIDSHDFKIGMRWMLGGEVAAPVYAQQAPLVRKY